MNNTSKQQPAQRSRRQQKVTTKIRAMLRDKLLAVGGTDVLCHDDDLHLGLVPLTGERFCQPVKSPDHHMTDFPHWNAVLYWARFPERSTLVTGYALDADGVWRNHSWILENDQLIETIAPKQAYFGVQLQEKLAWQLWDQEVLKATGQLLDK